MKTVSPSTRAEQIRRMGEAAANAMKTFSEEERREAARYLGEEHALPDPQEDLPLQQVA